MTQKLDMLYDVQNGAYLPEEKNMKDTIPFLISTCNALLLENAEENKAKIIQINNLISEITTFSEYYSSNLSQLKRKYDPKKRTT